MEAERSTLATATSASVLFWAGAFTGGAGADSVSVTGHIGRENVTAAARTIQCRP
jgi:hypothetical protein